MGEFAAVRGTAEADALVRFRRRFADLSVEIEVERIDEETAQIRVVPEATAPKQISTIRARVNPRVTLTREGREIASLPLASDGILFEDIQFGRYRLVFSRDGVEIGAYPFEIRDSPAEEKGFEDG